MRRGVRTHGELVTRHRWSGLEVRVKIAVVLGLALFVSFVLWVPVGRGGSSFTPSGPPSSLWLYGPLIGGSGLVVCIGGLFGTALTLAVPLEVTWRLLLWWFRVAAAVTLVACTMCIIVNAAGGRLAGHPVPDIGMLLPLTAGSLVSWWLARQGVRHRVWWEAPAGSERVVE